MHETGFFTVFADLYTNNPFLDNFGSSPVGLVALSAPFDASAAPEPASVLLFGTAMGAAMWAKARTGRRGEGRAARS